MCVICASFNPFLSDCEYEGLPHAPSGGGDGGPLGSFGFQGTTRYEVSGQDASDNTATAEWMAVGDAYQGNLHWKGDVDWIRVDLVAGQQYTIAAVGTGALANSNDDPYLRIRDASGSLIHQDDDDGPGRYSDHSFTASYTGSHYIDVQSWNNSDEGTYGVSVTQGAKASFNADMVAGTLLRPDAAWTSTAGTGATVSWSIRSSGTEPAGGNSFVAPSAAQVDNIRGAMAYIDGLSGLNLSQVNAGGASNSATIRFGAYNANDGAGAYAYYPGSTSHSANAGDVWLNNNSVSTGNLNFGSYSNFVVLHEIGHAIGLAHPGDYNAGSGGGSITYSNNAQFVQDSHQYTVMSYFGETSTGASNGLGYPDTYMLYDLLALHKLYGANTGYQSGNTTYGFNATNQGTAYDFNANSNPLLSIYDGQGADKIDLSGYSMAQRLDLTQGSFSDIGGYVGNVSVAYGAVIENAVGGTGNDTITGNGANNVIDGLTGTDTFVMNLDRDDVAFSGGPENLTVISALGLDRLQNVEFIQFNDQLFDLSALARPISGTAGNDTMTGSIFGDKADLMAGNDSFTSGAGNDTINGGLGSDTLIGEDGDDTYRVWESNPGDFDRLLDAEGNDDIADFSLFGAAIRVDLRNQDQAVATNDQTSVEAGGSFRAIAELVGIEHLNGTAFHDLIIGEGSSSGLDGLGGNDTIIGGAGDDSYRITISNPGDFDRLLDADGNDDFADLSGFNAAVRVDMRDQTNAIQTNDTSTASGGSFRVMAELVGIENFRGSGQNDHITGEGSRNRIEGGGGNDTIDGAGGNDLLWGGTGGDVFVFDDAHGRDEIRDFEVNATGERIDLSAVSAISSWADLPGHRMYQDGSATVIDTGTGNIRILNVDMGDLTPDDFIF